MEEKIRVLQDAKLAEKASKLLDMQKNSAFMNTRPRKNFNYIFRYGIATLACFVVCLLIVLPIALNGKDSATGGGNGGGAGGGGGETIVLPKKYAYDDIQEVSRTKLSSFDEIQDEILFFNIVSDFDGSVFLHKPLVDEEPVVLAYEFYSWKIDIGGVYFDASWTVRLYGNYDFQDIEHYENLSQNFDIFEFDVLYKVLIDNATNCKTAYIWFAYENIEYFIQITEIAELVEFDSHLFGVNETNLLLLINSLISA